MGALCAQEILERKSNGLRLMIIGVDFSNLIDECAAVCLKRGIHSRIGENPELKIFFAKLCYFLSLPATILFVFDGPQRPSYKRGRQVKTVPLWWHGHATRLIKDFGFHSYTAPGEAEAELAQLNSLGLIDAIITNDSDAFVFNAQRVFRRVAGPKDVSRYRAYSADKIQQSPNLNLTRGGLILLALMVGGDYDPIGIPGCGMLTALGLARSGFGDTLLNAKIRTNSEDFSQFLVNWRTDMQTELQTNLRGFLPNRSPSVAGRIDASFPNLEIIESYVAPLTSWSNQYDNEGWGGPPDTSGWVHLDPDLKSIATFCGQRFGWSNETIEKKFLSILCPGVLTSMLLSEYTYNDDQKVIATSTARAKVVRVSPLPNVDDIAFWKVAVSTENFFATAGLEGNTGSKKIQTVKIPECLLPPALLTSAKTSKKRSRGDKALAYACKLTDRLFRGRYLSFAQLPHLSSQIASSNDVPLTIEDHKDDAIYPGLLYANSAVHHGTDAIPDHLTSSSHPFGTRLGASLGQSLSFLHPAPYQQSTDLSNDVLDLTIEDDTMHDAVSAKTSKKRGRAKSSLSSKPLGQSLSFLHPAPYQQSTDLSNDVLDLTIEDDTMHDAVSAKTSKKRGRAKSSLSSKPLGQSLSFLHPAPYQQSTDLSNDVLDLTIEDDTMHDAVSAKTSKKRGRAKSSLSSKPFLRPKKRSRVNDVLDLTIEDDKDDADYPGVLYVNNAVHGHGETDNVLDLTLSPRLDGARPNASSGPSFSQRAPCDQSMESFNNVLDVTIDDTMHDAIRSGPSSVNNALKLHSDTKNIIDLTRDDD
ncbi:hypothetical protein H0H93_008969 [Arthromyces matolae]|nr:hypothetical protein H0H93_008969 [Arthromyces matolae]